MNFTRSANLQGLAMQLLIVDDHQLFIDGIRHVLVKLGDDVVINQANSADEAISALESGLQFDLVLLDLVMPGLNGLSIVHHLHEQGIPVPLVIVSGEENVRTIKSALELGVMGFIPKSFSGEEMLAALVQVMSGILFVPPSIAPKLDALKPRRFAHHGGITRRQLQVLELLAKGYTNRQIAASLCLTEHTIKAHVSALFIELKANNRTECVQVGEALGLV
ncbi:MAG: response regulator transcription factor [Marinobacter sp.]|nr:response regulator transcription factor [Marinobacter sp.]